MPKRKTKKRKPRKKTKKEILDEKEEQKIEKIKKREQIKAQDKILKNTLIGICVVFLIIIIVFAISYSLTHFEYQGVDFKIVKFCDAGPCITTYNTKIPVIYEGERVNYNFYLRNDPRKLEKEVPFDKSLFLEEDVYLDVAFDKHCEGVWKIAFANFLNLYQIIGVNISLENPKCDLSGESMYIMIRESDENSIEKFGPSCYNINVKECDILKATERFMVETFIKIN